MDKNSFEFREKRTATRYPVDLFVEFENSTGWTPNNCTLRFGGIPQNLTTLI
ncbi:MAG: hypothetical protein ACU88J_00420 [Gammaproteobacteria bacterium]